MARPLRSVPTMAACSLVVGTLLVLAAGLLAPSPSMAAQRPAQQRCIVSLGKAGVGVALAQATTNVRCLRRVGRGRVLDPGRCATDDADGLVAAATARTARVALDACDAVPDFGTPLAGELAVDAAAVAHLRGLLDDLLASSAGGAIVPALGAERTRRCQTGTVKDAAALTTTLLKAYATCTRKALGAGAAEAGALTPCVAADTKGVARTRRRLAARTLRRCAGVDLRATFPGVCAASADPGALAACAEARATCRACRVANAMGELSADCDALDDGAANDSCTLRVTLEGDAIPFHQVPSGRIEGATVSILELPGREVVTGPDGHFVFEGLAEGSDVTLVMDHPDYAPIQTGTIRLGPTGAERVTFQAVTYPIYDAFAAVLGIVPDPTRCQMVTTVTRVGKSIYDKGAHGEAAATVTLSPPLADDHGPVYFNASVIPDRTLTETSEDGGVLFVQGPPGEYVWAAHKPGVAFTRIRMKCRAGLLVNASPPWGLQAH